MDNRKFGINKWKNGVGERIEKKLKKTYENMGSVVEVQRFNRGIKEYSVRLTNGRCLVVRLRDETCSCKWWQLRGLPCVHAMAVIEREKLYVYDYINPCYKAPTQRTIYMNVIHPMETYDAGVVDGDTGLVVGGDDLDEDFNIRILPPKNPRGAREAKKEKGRSVNYNLPLPTGKLGLTGTEWSMGCSCEGSHSSSSSESDCTCSECNMTYHCDCQLEAKIVEHHDNYHRRYACCPKQDDYACGYFEEVNPQYPNRAMEAIDDLVTEMREARDVLLEERNNQYWMEEENRAIEDGMRAKLDELKGVVGVAFVAIVVLVAALLVMWSF
ncbi:hypothetical protein Cgig2_006864 [Carnegiea gigantea]|uniref:SWIM-type domain-containing protein n=1 Tax=Carnegiea gigantea TaxID=171969 RepID=A0A9Q1Q7T7_9CARY|nr:hypothetical protein Cgig2_006864 [Carnegiea gigantea]